MYIYFLKDHLNTFMTTILLNLCIFHISKPVTEENITTLVHILYAAEVQWKQSSAIKLMICSLLLKFMNHAAIWCNRCFLQSRVYKIATKLLHTHEEIAWAVLGSSRTFFLFKFFQHHRCTYVLKSTDLNSSKLCIIMSASFFVSKGGLFLLSSIQRVNICLFLAWMKTSACSQRAARNVLPVADTLEHNNVNRPWL